MSHARRALRSLLLLGAIFMPLLLVTGCKKDCPICDQYIGAVKKCQTKDAPSAKQLEKERKTCVGFCKMKMKAPVGEKRAFISRAYMARQMCVIDYENQGCASFLKCLAAVKKKGK